MISNVYSYYLNQYGNKSNSKYDSHTHTQLKNAYGKVIKLNSHAPACVPDFSEAAQIYAIDLKENASELCNIASDLSDASSGTMTYKKIASSSNPDSVDATYIGNSSTDVQSLEVDVSQIAARQINTGNYLQPSSKLIAPGDYTFDISINNLTYEFEISIDSSETTEDVQDKISRLINRADIGLHSNVTTNAIGNTSISIMSDTTGLIGISSNIFNIRANEDYMSSDVNPSTSSVANSTKNSPNVELIQQLGLNRITQHPSNAVYTLNGIQQSSSNNDINTGIGYVLHLTAPTDDTVTIKLADDTNSIVKSIDELVSGYNRLLSITSDKKNEQFEGNNKLHQEFSNIANAYQQQLSNNGLNIGNDQHIEIDTEMITNAANNGSLNNVFSTLDSFRDALMQKAEDIKINPMSYVNNMIIAYKNPRVTVADPYNSSAYIGMMFDDII